MFFCNYVLRSVKGLLGTYQKKNIVLTKKKFNSNEHLTLELSSFPILHAKHFVKNVLYKYCSFFNLASQMYPQKKRIKNWFQMNLIQPDDNGGKRNCARDNLGVA